MAASNGLFSVYCFKALPTTSATSFASPSQAAIRCSIPNALGFQARGAGAGVPAVELVQVDVRGVLHGGDEILTLAIADTVCSYVAATVSPNG